MRAVLFYGVRLPLQQYVDGKVETDYEYLFDENFVGSGWQFHIRQLGTRGRYSSYLCLERLNVSLNSAEPFLFINPKGLREKKMTPPEREELKDIMQSLGVGYASPKWFLTTEERWTEN